VAQVLVSQTAANRDFALVGEDRKHPPAHPPRRSGSPFPSPSLPRWRASDSIKTRRAFRHGGSARWCFVCSLLSRAIGTEVANK
jgi:hypothetical protein